MLRIRGRAFVECVRFEAVANTRLAGAAGLLACLLMPTSSIAQAGGGIITGRVIDGNGSPLRGALITIHGIDSRGAVSDSAGLFIIQNVPPGEHVVLARTIGFDVDAAFLDMRGGDSVEVRLQIDPTPLPIAGAGWPLPAAEELASATGLLAKALRHPAVTSFINRHSGDSFRRDSVVVWAPWITNGDGMFVRAGPVFRVVRHCARCATEYSATIEGGRVYRVTEAHVTVTVRATRTGTRQLEFYLGLAEPGDRILLQGGPGENSLRVTCAQRPDGDWVCLRLDASQFRARGRGRGTEEDNDRRIP